ncbi:ATP-binding protein [Uliginosibacterium flavum]|uniref:Uncharacterized AAA domain-containing protein ycf46 n=1 Tax=Uliginosibacterium flavum TaxID=1396831 RepID=A0ABV2TM66_9RHOO
MAGLEAAPVLAVGAGPLPEWAETIRRKYLGGEASIFILHGNIFDRVLSNGRLWELTDFLAHCVLWQSRERILHLDPTRGVRALKGKAEHLLEAPADGDWLAALESSVIGGSDKLALIVSYASSLMPAGDESFLSSHDRLNAVRLHRWSLDPALAAKDNIVFLLSESLVELNARLLSNPRIAAVEVPLPDFATREAAVKHVDPDASPSDAARLAQHAAGLRVIQLCQLLTPATQSTPDDAARTALIQQLLGSSKDADERARKLATLTQGMAVEDIRHLINPEKPAADAAPVDEYAEVLQVLHRRKREIIERECSGLIEFVESSHDLSAVGGNEAIKAELMQVAHAIKTGETNRVPMGMLFVGPMGCGKTFVAKAFVKSSGLSAVTLKNFRSKWVGSTESNLEKVLSMVKSLGPIIMIIDEGDRSFGAGSEDGDSGTSSRIIARLKEFMSDTDNRGKVLFILMTNRPDKLDIDIKRAGRLDRKIPFFYPEDVAAVEASVLALAKRYRFSLQAVETSMLERLVGYSYADIEAVMLMANDLAQTAQTAEISLATLEQAITDYLPNRDRRMVEFMELQAVLESSRRSMLPRKYRELSEEALQLQIKQLRLELRL